MTGARGGWNGVLISAVVAAMLVTGLWRPTIAAAAIIAVPVTSSDTLSPVEMLLQPAKHIHRLLTRTERELIHLGAFLQEIGALWLWFALSVAAFFTVTSFSSVVDRRMWSLRRQGPGVLGRYLGHGLRTFFRILRDRRTPYLARAVLAGALLYWLLPTDLIDDSSLWPGFVDDVLIAVLAAKGFMYLCPDALIAKHAAAVTGRA